MRSDDRLAPARSRREDFQGLRTRHHPHARVGLSRRGEKPLAEQVITHAGGRWLDMLPSSAAGLSVALNSDASRWRAGDPGPQSASQVGS